MPGPYMPSGNKVRAHIIQIQAQNLRHAVLLHRDAVEDVGGLHRAAAVGDDNELGAVRHAAQILRIARDVYVVQRGLDLIEEAERRGVDAQDGEIDRDSDQRLLAAGKRGQVLDDLARGETSISMPDSSTFASSDRYSRA